MEKCGQLHAPATLPPTPCIYCIGGWVDPKKQVWMLWRGEESLDPAGYQTLDTVTKNEISAPTRNQTLVFRPPE
jgi:hypothetical protein